MSFHHSPPPAVPQMTSNRVSDCLDLASRRCLPLLELTGLSAQQVLQHWISNSFRNQNEPCFCHKCSLPGKSVKGKRVSTQQTPLQTTDAAGAAIVTTPSSPADSTANLRPERDRQRGESKPPEVILTPINTLPCPFL